jgi:hypothetical protein
MTIAMAKHDVPASFRYEDTLALFNVLYTEQFENKESRYLSGMSRNGYFEWMIDRILRAAQIDGLGFLAGRSYMHRCLVADGYREVLATVVADGQLDSCILDLKSIEIWVQQSPEEFANLNGGGFSGKDVLHALNAASASCYPNSEAPYSDDGDSLEYFFACMKMLLTIFEYAKSHQMCVIHTLEQSV